MIPFLIALKIALDVCEEEKRKRRIATENALKEKQDRLGEHFFDSLIVGSVFKRSERVDGVLEDIGTEIVRAISKGGEESLSAEQLEELESACNDWGISPKDVCDDIQEFDL